MNVQLNPHAMTAVRHLPFECVALVLQGGGALGACQAAAYEALAEAGIRAIYYYSRAGKPIARGAHEAEWRAIEVGLTSLLKKPDDAAGYPPAALVAARRPPSVGLITEVRGTDLIAYRYRHT